ncbi:MAG TPA: hypothetical protein DCR43_08125 [Bacteroidales bacterium]|nr:MAG: hypothetical protein A2X11_15255 [Bacteroidetes bacterium GWE2_42_24]OFY31700.1 MAG: hypothetical protein A2X09_09000 [Bacteroidetes bacterium GWF2_43_11]HAQ65801.1 hypothetical protein [Bacteroidales bacterium]HBZ67034.1 hypothetical protein [Bacteroidales bacterium]
MQNLIKNTLAFVSIIALTTFSACSKSEETPQSVETYFTPIAAFAFTMEEKNGSMLVTFTNTSSYADTYKWEFGDGNSSASGSPTHVYPIPVTKPKLYTIVLTASHSENGLSNKSSRILTINPPE